MSDMLLFTPYCLKRLELKNRLVMLAAGTEFATSDGYMTQRQIDYYAKRAEGGVGLIMVEQSYIEPAGKVQAHMLGLHDDDHIPGFRRLAEIAHSYGTKIIVQTSHAGREASPKITGAPSVAPSPIPSPMRRLSDGSTDGKPKELTIEEIEGIVEKFGEFARRAKEAGLDGIELLCGHRCLPEQFLFSDSNRRQDKYGGSIENRARFICDIVRRFRKKAGEDFIISCRVPATEYPEGGYTNEEIKKVFKMLEEAGADVFNVSVAGSRQWVNLLPMAFPRGSLVPFCQWVKTFTNVPVLCGVRINDPLLAESILRQEKADLIGMARPLICDPELPRKAIEGRFEDIRMCIACNVGCSQRLYAHLPISCTLNVEVGREKELEIKPAPRPKKILVIGGGPAGMEVARVAALRGHEVLLYEKASELGGQLLLARISPHKEEIDNISSYLKCQIEKLGVKIELGKEVNQELAQQIAPDVVIVATGATPVIPDIPGVDGTNVRLAKDVLLGKPVGQRVAVIGGGQVGVETAEFLADRGKEVVVIEMLERIAEDLEPISRMFMRHRLAQKGVKILTGTRVVGIGEDSLVVQKDGKGSFIPAESVVVAVGSKPNNELAQSLEGKFPVHFIGDCVEARGILEAIHEGSLLARQL